MINIKKNSFFYELMTRQGYDVNKEFYQYILRFLSFFLLLFNFYTFRNEYSYFLRLQNTTDMYFYFMLTSLHIGSTLFCILPRHYAHHHMTKVSSQKNLIVKSEYLYDKTNPGKYKKELALYHKGLTVVVNAIMLSFYILCTYLFLVSFFLIFVCTLFSNFWLENYPILSVPSSYRGLPLNILLLVATWFGLPQWGIKKLIRKVVAITIILPLKKFITISPLIENKAKHYFNLKHIIFLRNFSYKYIGSNLNKINIFFSVWWRKKQFNIHDLILRSFTIVFFLYIFAAYYSSYIMKADFYKPNEIIISKVIDEYIYLFIVLAIISNVFSFFFHAFLSSIKKFRIFSHIFWFSLTNAMFWHYIYCLKKIVDSGKAEIGQAMYNSKLKLVEHYSQLKTALIEAYIQYVVSIMFLIFLYYIGSFIWNKHGKNIKEYFGKKIPEVKIKEKHASDILEEISKNQ